MPTCRPRRLCKSPRPPFRDRGVGKKVEFKVAFTSIPNWLAIWAKPTKHLNVTAVTTRKREGKPIISTRRAHARRSQYRYDDPCQAAMLSSANACSPASSWTRPHLLHDDWAGHPGQEAQSHRRRVGSSPAILATSQGLRLVIAVSGSDRTTWMTLFGNLTTRVNPNRYHQPAAGG